MVPKNVVKCLLFTGNVKPFKSLCTVGVSRCKRKGKSWHEKWMIKIFQSKDREEEMERSNVIRKASRMETEVKKEKVRMHE